MPYHRCSACGLTSYSAAAHSAASVCPNCSAALREDSKLYLVPGARRDLGCSFSVRPQAAAEARRALVGLALPAPTRETLALVVSELVSNAVRHAGLFAGDAIRLRITNGDGRVRVEVHDRGHGFKAPTADADPLTPGGQGLVIVAAVSEAWGVGYDDDGCTVWAEVAVDEVPLADPELVPLAGVGGV